MATIKEMEARSAGFHHLEEIVSAPVLLKGLTVHLRELSTLLNGSADDAGSDLRRRLIVVTGESSVLASDVGDSATARNFYDTAIEAAKQADDPAIAACALAYRSYIPSTKGANGRARILLTEALENISETESPATVAWIAARHAEESAQLGDNSQALASWERAEEAFSICDPDEDRAWTRFLDQNRFDSYRIATYSKIGRLDEAQEIAATVLGRLMHSSESAAAATAESLLQELGAIPPGKAEWFRYQKLCRDIVAFLFCPPLGKPISERSNRTGTNRRDIILPNYTTDSADFWAQMRSLYEAHFLA